MLQMVIWLYIPDKFWEALGLLVNHYDHSWEEKTPIFPLSEPYRTAPQALGIPVGPLNDKKTVNLPLSQARGRDDDGSQHIFPMKWGAVRSYLEFPNYMILLGGLEHFLFLHSVGNSHPN